MAKSDEEYGNPYGIAFQNYVGDVLRAQFNGPTHHVREEQQYWIKNNKKDGVDWIVSDSSGHIMIECKTRRIRVDAKAIVDGDPLTKAIEDFAEIVVQHYKNVNDALKGKTQWKYDDKPVFPMVVTLDDWYLCAPHVVDMLQAKVHEKMANIKLTGLLESLPFIATSIAELEKAGQAIAQIGINRFCFSRIHLQYRHFGLHQHASENFPDIKVEYRKLFAKSDQEMFGHLEHLIRLPGPTE